MRSRGLCVVPDIQIADLRAIDGDDAEHVARRHAPCTSRTDRHDQFLDQPARVLLPRDALVERAVDVQRRAFAGLVGGSDIRHRFAPSGERRLHFRSEQIERTPRLLGGQIAPLERAAQIVVLRPDRRQIAPQRCRAPWLASRPAPAPLRPSRRNWPRPAWQRSVPRHSARDPQPRSRWKCSA